MSKISIIIPTKNEKFLNPTIKDLLKNARGDIEILPVLDGYWPPAEEIITDPRVNYIHVGESRGMRNAINMGASMSKGDYLMKIDGHCMVDEGFDVKLLADMQDNWVVIPRRKRLDAENWCLQDVGKPDIDYEYLCFPYNKPDEVGMHGNVWTKRILERQNKEEYLIDENMSFQGSCWFMKKEYFEFLELMDDKNYGIFANEAQEIGFKAWLSGGKVMTNKKTWYAHLHKGKKFGRGYFIDKKQFDIARDYTLKWLDNKAWNGKQVYPFEWFIERFSPVPTWPENWKDELSRLHNK